MPELRPFTDVASAGRSMIRRRKDGLAQWQIAKAKAIVEFGLKSGISLSKLAAECEMSRSGFIRAFEVSFEMTPHEWLQARRIEMAKILLSRTGMPLKEIAAECVFADQSHMSKSFSKLVGTPPGTWRRGERRRGQVSPHGLPGDFGSADPTSPP